MNHITSKFAPHYPQSNGWSEKYVQIVKKLVLKSKGGRQRLVPMFDDLLPYPIIKYFAITNANISKQIS